MPESSDHNMQPPPERRCALVIGGCHVTSYGIGDAPPFWTGTVERWGASSVEVHGPMSISKALRIVRSRLPLAPHTLVVLQLGHHDVWKELALLNPLTAFHVRRSRQDRSKSLLMSSDNETVIQGDKSNIRLIKTFLRGAVASGLDLLLIRSTLWAQAVFRLKSQFEAVINALREGGAEEIIVVSPFPTISPRINLHRQAVRSFMAKMASNNNFRFIDVWPELAYGKGIFLSPHRDTLLDAVHLSAQGHNLVSTLIQEKIRTNGKTIL